MGINEVTFTVYHHVVKQLDDDKGFCKICVLHIKVYPMQSDIITGVYLKDGSKL
jgi:hypothetical protein